MLVLVNGDEFPAGIVAREDLGCGSVLNVTTDTLNFFFVVEIMKN